VGALGLSAAGLSSFCVQPLMHTKAKTAITISVMLPPRLRLAPRGFVGEGCGVSASGGLSTPLSS